MAGLFLPCLYHIPVASHVAATKPRNLISFPECRCTMLCCIQMHGHPRSLINVTSNSSFYSVTFVMLNNHMVLFYGVEAE
jgi:hypothetical protein